jgi:hypothetical protein
MDASREQALSELLDTSDAFVWTLARLSAALEQQNLTLDELVVNSRTPVRTALLLVRQLTRNGQVQSMSGTLTLANRMPRAMGHGFYPPTYTLPTSISRLRDIYCNAVAVREAPSLLWGQRRLLPRSALDRAAYVLAFAGVAPRPARYIFLGDDDLVSPLVAAADVGSVLTIDIDRAVVDGVKQVAAVLRAELTTLHEDVSANGTLSECNATVVICDPFPSADGSFERMFWLRAASCLCLNGILITTVAPSHKPEEYASGALSALRELGFQLLDLRPNFGQYEVFDFEFVAAERMLMRDLGLRAGVSHTKSLLAARLVGRPSAAHSQQLDFRRWTEATKRHYLTQQAGLAEQQHIIQERGTGGDWTRREIVSSAKGAASVLGSCPSADWEQADWLDLAQRAVESWRRHRLDA